MCPEDKIRAHIIGWGGSADVLEALKEVKPQELKLLKQEYAHKYGSSLDADLMNKLSGENKTEALRILASNESVDEQYLRARDQYSHTRSGFGSRFSRIIREAVLERSLTIH